MPMLDSPTIPSSSRSGALQGLTLLAVEDSRYAGEALRLMTQRSGARLRRAESLTSARRHLKLYRPDLMLVDIGLPDGSGLELIAEVAALPPERTLPMIAMSGDEEPRAAALAAGAAMFLEKPLPGLQRFQTEVLRLLPGYRGEMASDLPVSPDPLALSEDLARAAELLEEEASQNGDDGGRRYLALFLGGIARHTHDGNLARAAAAYRDRESGASGSLARLLRLRLRDQPRPFSMMRTP